MMSPVRRKGLPQHLFPCGAASAQASPGLERLACAHLEAPLHWLQIPTQYPEYQREGWPGTLVPPTTLAQGAVRPLAGAG